MYVVSFFDNLSDAVNVFENDDFFVDNSLRIWRWVHIIFNLLDILMYKKYNFCFVSYQGKMEGFRQGDENGDEPIFVGFFVMRSAKSSAEPVAKVQPK